MARRLDRIAPTSSVGRLLDSAAAAGAFAAPQPRPVAPTERVQRRPVSSLIKRELVLSRDADRQFQALIDACRQSTRTRLTASHVARALMRVVAGAMPSIVRSLEEQGPHRLPSNAPSFEPERVRFESHLAMAIARGLSASADAHSPGPSDNESTTHSDNR